MPPELSVQKFICGSGCHAHVLYTFSLECVYTGCRGIFRIFPTSKMEVFMRIDSGWNLHTCPGYIHHRSTGFFYFSDF